MLTGRGHVDPNGGGLAATLTKAFAIMVVVALSAALSSALPNARQLHRPPRIVLPPKGLIVASREPKLAPRLVQPAMAAGCKYSAKFLLELACPVVDEETGKSLEYCQLKHHPKLSKIWLHLYSNKMGHLC